MQAGLDGSSSRRAVPAHAEVMDTLIAVLLGDRADATFTSADPAAIGVDDTAGPNSADYDLGRTTETAGTSPMRWRGR